ncbi:MAG: hypothetical protein ACKVU1_17360 [bacterium]
MKPSFGSATTSALSLMALGVGAVLVAGGLWPGEPRTSIDGRLSIWFDILAAFAFVAGGRSIVARHAVKIAAREAGWRYSAIAVTAFLVTLSAGLFKLGAPSWETPLSDARTWFRALTDGVYAPVQSALAIVVAFALIFALHRAARRRARALWPMLACALCVVAANTPLSLIRDDGAHAPARARAFAGAAYEMLAAIGTGAQRALMIGIAIGAVALALRVLLRLDRPA